MVQFVPYFLGQRKPPYDGDQHECIRTPDIDEVGITTRHNTFFQMAGNFSFGDYFKRRAIELAWSLLTNSVEEGGYGFDPEQLWATVYLDDDEAAQLWQEVAGLPARRIQRRDGRQLLVDGHSRAVRPVVGDLRTTAAPTTASKAARSPTRTATSRSGISCSCRTSAEGPQEGIRDPRPAAAQEHRHRHGRRTGRVPAAGCRQRLRDGPAAPGHRHGRRRVPAGYGAGNHEDDVPVPDHRRPQPHRGDPDRRRQPRQRRRGYVLRRCCAA